MRKILFIELLGGIGDVLIALDAIQALSRSHPDAEMTVLTFPPGGELLETDLFVNRVVYAERGKAKQSVVDLLSSETFDLIVSDTSYDDIDVETLHVTSLHKDLRVITNLWRQPPPNERVGERFVKILLAEGLINPDSIQPAQLHLTPDELNKAQQQFNNFTRPLIFFCSDAGMNIKLWPEVNFITLGQILQQRWGASIIVTVGSDLNQAENIAQGISKIRSPLTPLNKGGIRAVLSRTYQGGLGGSISYPSSISGQAQIFPRGQLRDLAAALACADLVVAADTGAARIAAALNIPTITLFGPSWHGRYGQPLPHTNLQGYPDCPERNISNFTLQECWYGGVCPLDKGWQTCMEDISVEQVLNAVEKFLKSRIA